MPHVRPIVAQGMTLLELRAAFPKLFYRQDWFRDQRFMNYYPAAECPMPTVGRVGRVPVAGERLPRAVDLAHAFVRDPSNPLWRHFWWCADTDAIGQRIYVGGASPMNNHLFEIHRHLHVTDKWVIAA